MPRNGRTSIQKAQRAPKKPLKIKEALHKGELLSGVKLNGNKVILELKPQFNHPEKYASINKAFFDLYYRSETFRKKFELPKRDRNGLRVLTLKYGHGYTNNQEILAALQAFAAPTRRLGVKEKLREGALLANAILEDTRVTLVLRPEYDHPDNYPLINKVLYKIYRGHESFAAKFEMPTQGAHPPVLILKEGHDYEDGEAVLSALKKFAALSLKRLPIKEALAQGLLLSGVNLEGNCVTLKLQQSYNELHFYQKINQSLHLLHSRMADFATKFERPKVSYEPPILVLKANHGFKNEAEIVMALRKFSGFVSEDPEKTQCIQQAVAPVEVPFDVTRYLEEIIPTTVPLSESETSAEMAFANAFPQDLKLASCSQQKMLVNVAQALTPQQVSNTIRNALIAGKLFFFAVLFENQADLSLSADYQHPNYDDAIISRVYDLYADSAELRQKVEYFSLKGGILRAQLRQGHGYQDGKALLTDLIEKAFKKYCISTYLESVPPQEAMHGNEIGAISLTLTSDVVAQAIAQQTDEKTDSRKSLAWLYQLQTSAVSSIENAMHESALIPCISPVTRFRE